MTTSRRRFVLGGLGRRYAALGVLVLASRAWAAEAPPASPAAAPATATAAGATPIAPAPSRGPAPSGPARWDESYVGFDDFPIVSGSEGNVSTSIQTFFYQGRYKRPLRGAEFYEVVGRPDLAAVYRERATRGQVIAGVGLAIVVAGVLYGVAAGRNGPDVGAPDFRQQMDAQYGQVQTAGLVILGGAVLALVGVAQDPNPVGVVEARRLADEHNQRLLRSASPGTSAAPRDRGDGSAVAVRLGVAPGGGMAGLAVVF